MAKKNNPKAKGRKEPQDSDPSRESPSSEVTEAKESKESKEPSKEPKSVEVAATTSKPDGNPASGNKVAAFLEGTREELDKVVWPSRQQLISESLAVILMVTLSATLIYFVDNLFSWAAKQVF